MTRPFLPERIATRHLALRPYELDDVDDALGYATDEEWGRYLPLPFPYLRSDAEKFIAAQILLDREAHPSWALVLDDRVVGGINIRFDFDHGVGEIGYATARPLWGRGFATEAARAVVDAAFATHLDLNRVRAMADARNVASHRVLTKTGLAREGVLRQNRVVRGVPIDEVWFGILRSEWDSDGAS
jgi:RimJ/RimL family protein N-acetyltransferase